MTMFTNSKYDAIPEPTMHDEEHVGLQAETTTSSAGGGLPVPQRSYRMAYTFVVLAVIGGVTMTTRLVSTPSATSATADGSTFLVPQVALAAPTKACTFDECYASKCNQQVAPYTCLWHNGGPHGGCSPTPWTSASCNVSCDLSGCHHLAIPDSVAKCSDTPCTTTWCQRGGGQVCPTDVPYQCMVGSARFGCSADALTWTLFTDGATCSSCCDASACAL